MAPILLSSVDAWATAGAEAQPPPAVSYVPCDREQVRRVVRRIHTAPEHPIVTGVLALDAQLPAGDPHQRVEPVHRAQRFRGDLYRPITSHDVRELVREHDVDPIGGPRIGGGGHDDAWPHQSPCDEQCPIGTFNDDDRTTKSVLVESVGSRSRQACDCTGRHRRVIHVSLASPASRLTSRHPQPTAHMATSIGIHPRRGAACTGARAGIAIGAGSELSAEPALVTRAGPASTEAPVSAARSREAAHWPPRRARPPSTQCRSAADRRRSARQISRARATATVLSTTTARAKRARHESLPFLAFAINSAMRSHLLVGQLRAFHPPSRAANGLFRRTIEKRIDQMPERTTCGPPAASPRRHVDERHRVRLATDVPLFLRGPAAACEPSSSWAHPVQLVHHFCRRGTAAAKEDIHNLPLAAGQAGMEGAFVGLGVIGGPVQWRKC